jgi:hypothetical protein
MERIRGQGRTEGGGPGKELATVHVLIRPDRNASGNPGAFAGYLEDDCRFVAEQLKALAAGRPAEQLPVEVVRLLVVVHPPADQRDQALVLGKHDPVDSGMPSQFGDELAVGPLQLFEHRRQAVDTGCCHAALLPQAPSGMV